MLRERPARRPNTYARYVLCPRHGQADTVAHHRFRLAARSTSGAGASSTGEVTLAG